MGCNVTLIFDEEKNRIVGTSPHPYSKTEKGYLCIKGWNVFEFVQKEGRLTSPLIRKNEILVPTTWKKALDYVSNKLLEIKEKYGPDSISIFGSAKTTNEDNYLLQKFYRSE